MSQSLCDQELVENGDFETANALVSSDYQLTDKPCCCQTYAIKPNAYAFHPRHWFTRDDHTFGSDSDPNDTIGNFFIGDAQCNSLPLRAWYQTVNVTAGATYVFSSWVSNLDDDIYQNDATFQLTVNATPLMGQYIQAYSIGDDDTEDRWQQICGVYEATVSGPVEIAVSVLTSTTNPSLIGADFGLDDISFRASGANADFNIVSTYCAGEEVAFFSTDQNPTLHHSWNYGSSDIQYLVSTTANPRMIYNEPGSYTVTHTVSSKGCTSTTSRTIQIIKCPTPEPCVFTSCDLTYVENGDFDNSNRFIDSDYGYQNPGYDFGQSCDGEYTVDNTLNRPDYPDEWDKTIVDHTGQYIRGFFISDAPCSSVSISELWKSYPDVPIGQVYVFKAWVSNISTDPNNKPIVALKVNDVYITNPTLIEYDSENHWVEICGQFSTANLPQGFCFGDICGLEVSVDIWPSTDGLASADVALDDISFSPISESNNASFTMRQETSCTGETTSFVSSDQVNNHYWSFEGNPTFINGTNSSSKNPEVVYDNPGSYHVVHYVINSSGCTSEASVTLDIKDCCQMGANFTWESKEGSCIVDFSDFSLSGSGTVITSWDWQFIPNDPNATGSGPNPSFKYASSGVYPVTLTISGYSGKTPCSQSITIPVSPGCVAVPDTCDAAFSIVSTYCAGEEVAFHSADQNPSLSHTWDYGSSDIQYLISTTANPRMIYNEPGTYRITHTVSNENCRSTTARTIQIMECQTFEPCEISGCNLTYVENGDFENSNRFIESDYGYQNPQYDFDQSCDGEYTVDYTLNRPAYPDEWDKTIIDHSPELHKRGFFISDAPCSSVNITELWRSYADVDTGQIYVFSAWISNISTDPNNKPIVALKVNDVYITHPNLIEYDAQNHWVEICGQFNATNLPIEDCFANNCVLNVSVDIWPSTDGLASADIALDDISFSPMEPDADPSFTMSKGASCTGETTRFVSADQVGDHWWSFDGDPTFVNGTNRNSKNPEVIYYTPGTYHIYHNVSNSVGCSSESSTYLEVEHCIKHHLYKVLPMPRTASESLENREAVYQIFPNPFKGSLNFELEINKEDVVIIEMYDLRGAFISNITRQNAMPGKFTYRWIPKAELSMGVYLLKIQVGDNIHYEKVLFSGAY